MSLEHVVEERCTQLRKVSRVEVALCVCVCVCVSIALIIFPWSSWNSWSTPSQSTHPVVGDDLKAVFLEVLCAVFLRRLVELDAVSYRHTRYQCLLTPGKRDFFLLQVLYFTKMKRAAGERRLLTFPSAALGCTCQKLQVAR